MIFRKYLAFIFLFFTNHNISIAGEIGNSIVVNQTGSAFETPKIAAIPNGGFISVWVETGTDFPEVIPSLDGDGAGIFARIFDKNNMPVTNDFRVNQATAGEQWSPDVAADSEGNFVVTWTTNIPDGRSIIGAQYIYARRFSANGNPISDEFTVNTNTPYTNVRSVITMNAFGDFIIAWMGTDTNYGGFGVYAKRFNSNGVPYEDEFLVNNATEYNQSYPSVSMNNSGAFIITWDDGYEEYPYNIDGIDGSKSGIVAQLFGSDGNEIGSEILINSYTLGNQRYPQVTITESGTFAVIWSDESDRFPSFQDIYGKIFDEFGNAVSDEFLVATDVFGHVTYGPSISTTHNGNYIIVYTTNGSSDSGNTVFGRRFSITGEALEDAFVVHRGIGADVNTYSNGDFIVIWKNTSGLPRTINAQRYDSGPVTANVSQSDGDLNNNTGTGSTVLFELFSLFIFIYITRKKHINAI